MFTMKQSREKHIGRLVSKSEKTRATLLWGRMQGTVSKSEKAGAADKPGVAVTEKSFIPHVFHFAASHVLRA